jgi:hypothetical protein
MLTPPQSDVAGVVAGLTVAECHVVKTGSGDRATCCDIFAIEPSLCSVINLDGNSGRLSLFTPLGLAARQMILAASQRTTGDEG